jgi:putative iron-only hydrogenase system regulator
METRVAIIAIIVENPDSVEKLNCVLHDYSEYIIGRMGIPYREKKVSIISIAIDATQDMISALSGKIGKLAGIRAKTVYSNVCTKHEE